MDLKIFFGIILGIALVAGLSIGIPLSDSSIPTTPPPTPAFSFVSANSQVISAGNYRDTLYMDSDDSILINFTNSQVNYSLNSPTSSRLGGIFSGLCDSSNNYTQTGINSNGTIICEQVLGGGGGAGEINTASNVGSGVGVFQTKTGVDLRFHSLIAGANITITDLGDELQINATSGGGSGPIDNIHDIGNVTDTGCSLGQILKVSGVSWGCSNDLQGGGSSLSPFGYIVYKDGSDTVSVFGNNGTEKIRSTNSYNVIQDAINSTGIDSLGVSFGSVFLKAGTYSMTDTLVINQTNNSGNIMLLGEGWKTVLQYNGQTISPALQISDPIIAAYHYNGFVLRDLRLTSTVIDNGTALDIIGCEGCEFRNLKIDGWNKGIRLTGVSTYFNIFDHIDLEVGGTKTASIGIEIGPDANQNFFNAITAFKMPGDQTLTTIANVNSYMNKFENINFEGGVIASSFPLYAFDFGGTSDGSQISNGWIEHVQTPWRINSGAEHIGFYNIHSHLNTNKPLDSGKDTIYMGTILDDEPQSKYQGIVGSRRTSITASSGGIVTLPFNNTSFIIVDTFGGAASQNILNIVGAGIDGQILVITPINSSHDLILNDVDNTNEGYLVLSGSADYTMNTATDTVTFIYDGPNKRWLELSRSDN